MSDSTDGANFVLGLFSPYRFKIDRYKGYDVVALQDRLRGIKILKNRDGNADVVMGMLYTGEVGLFEELPTSDTMSPAHYARIKQIKKLEYNAS